MPLQLDWQIGDDGSWEEQERAKPLLPPRPPLLWRSIQWIPPWAWYALLGAVVVVGLGSYLAVRWRYIAAQEQLAFQIQSVIDLEGRAFIEGDMDLYLAQQDRGAAEWYELQDLLIRAAEKWPAAGTVPFVGVPAKVQRVELHEDVAWVEVVEGSPAVRRMRFYRRTGRGWLHTMPDRAFWGDEVSIDAGEWLTVRYYERDRPHVGPLIELLEQNVAQICATIGCPMKLTLAFVTYLSEGSRGDIAFSSPWLSGIPADGSSWPSSTSTMEYPGEPVRRAVLHVLVDRVASERFWPTLWMETPLREILQEYVAWLSGCDPAEAPILGPIVTEYGEDILPAVFDSLTRGSFAAEFPSERVESGSGERNSVPPN